MRIIKLSAQDEDFKKPEEVHNYFRDKLRKRQPPGQFLLTERAIGKSGISPGESLVFTYNGKCVYKARAASDRRVNRGQDSGKYRYYFLVDTASIEPVSGNLQEIQYKLEQEGMADKDLVRSRAWPTFPDGERIAQIIEAFLRPVPGTGHGLTANQFDFRRFALELNDAAHSRDIGAFQKIRAALHGTKQQGDKIFQLQTIFDTFAFHYGGRKELQFNIGFDGTNGEMLRSGVGFSFETNQTLPVIDP